MRVERLSPVLGCRVAGVDLADADDATMRRLLDAFYRHQVLVVSGQSLTPRQFLAFGRAFGRPQLHILKHLRHAEVPEILPLSNIFVDGEPIGVFDGAAYWHTDMSYEAEPGGATIVHSIHAPAEGGDTRFADMYAAYAALPAATRRRIDGLTVVHHYGNRRDMEEASRTSATPLREAERREIRNVHHPLVLRHPVTGRKALYGISGASFGIVGMPDEEAVALLDELVAHATRPEFVHAHHYAVGDVLAWDNLSTLHSASLIGRASCPEDTRLLHRISTKGLPPLLGGGRIGAAPAAEP